MGEDGDKVPLKQQGPRDLLSQPELDCRSRGNLQEPYGVDIQIVPSLEIPLLSSIANHRLLEFSSTTVMFLQRSALTAARRAAVSPIIRRGFVASVVRRECTY